MEARTEVGLSILAPVNLVSVTPTRYETTRFGQVIRHTSSSDLRAAAHASSTVAPTRAVPLDLTSEFYLLVIDFWRTVLAKQRYLSRGGKITLSTDTG